MTERTTPPVYTLNVSWGQNGANDENVVVLDIEAGAPVALLTPKRAFELGTELIEAARLQGYDKNLPQTPPFAA